MSKLNWNKAEKRDLVKKRGYEIIETEREQKKRMQIEDPLKDIDLKEHKDHTITIEVGTFGPHTRKLICKTCNKLIKWLPKL